MRRVLTAVAMAVLAGTAGVRGDDTAARWWSHVEALANDGMEGRNTGSPGHKRAAEYIAAQFKKAGLDPAGVGGYIQPVAFKTRRIVEDKSSLALIRNGKTEALALGEDANISVRVDPAPSVDAPLVFVGYGLNIPERRINDFAGVNLKGAVVVYVSSHAEVAARPAAGAFRIRRRALEDVPGRRRDRHGQHRQPEEHGHPVGALDARATAAGDVARRRGAGRRARAAVVGDDEPGARRQAVRRIRTHLRRDARARRRRQTGAELRAAGPPEGHRPPSSARRSSRRTSPGSCDGSDPRRRDEFVVVSAHLDHLGIGGAVNGDTIYNGAMDNASGIAAILEVAASLHESNAKPARSILFVAVTGEEKGELGSRYFAAHPTVPRASIVADVNTDMFLPLFPLKTLMVLGLDESDLGTDIRATAKTLGIGVQADPEPQRNRFVRSDQYSFVKVGIPAAGDEGGLRREHAGSGDRGEVDRGAVSRSVGRSEPAGRSSGRRQVRRGGPRSRRCTSPTAPIDRSGMTPASSNGFQNEHPHTEGQRRDPHGGRRAVDAAALRAAQRSRPAGPAVRLRARPVRRVHGDHQRRGDALLRHAGLGGAAAKSPRSKDWPRTASCIRCSRRGSTSRCRSAASARTARS